MIGAWVIVVTAGVTCLIMAAVFAIFHQSDPHKSDASAFWGWGYLVGAIAWSLNVMRDGTHGSVFIWLNNATFLGCAILLSCGIHAFFGKRLPQRLYIAAALLWMPLYTYGLIDTDAYQSFLLRSVATGVFAGIVLAQATFMAFRMAQAHGDKVEFVTACFYGTLALMCFALIPPAVIGIGGGDYFSSANFIILYVIEPPLVVGIGMCCALMLMRRVVEELRSLADCDPLTGLLNRRGFMSRFDTIFENAVARGGDLALVILDIDRFKEVNNRFGHTGGDRVLVEFADILREHLKPGQICGRQGGEEFAILLPDCGNEDVREFVEALRADLASGRIVMDGRTVNLTFTTGHTTYLGETTAFEMLRRADGHLNRTRLVDEARRSTAQSRSAKLMA